LTGFCLLGIYESKLLYSSLDWPINEKDFYANNGTRFHLTSTPFCTIIGVNIEASTLPIIKKGAMTMLATALKEARKRAGKTLREVAEATGVSIGFISDIEHGRKRTTTEVLEKMEKVLGVTDNSLVQAGYDATNLKEKLKFLYEARPHASYALARLAEDGVTDDQLLEVLKKISK
jgi:transcriptional regulator with XRE-family HTH domain